MTLDVRLCIVLVISCDIWKHGNLHIRHFYYKSRDGEKMVVPISFEDKSVNRVVVYMGEWIIIGEVLVEMIGEFEEGEAYIRNFDGSRELRHKCKLEYGSYECEAVGLFIVVESKSKLMTKVESTITRNYVDEYIGCFKNQNISFQLKGDVAKCRFHCETFYGVDSERNCICVQNLNELVQADLNQCTYVISLKLYGNDSHFAVYLKDFNRTLGYPRPSWDCIYELKDCPKCPKGMMGMYCELRDCSVDNGNCGDSKCQAVTLFTLLNFTSCFCTSGYHVGLVQCEEGKCCLTRRRDRLRPSDKQIIRSGKLPKTVIQNYVEVPEEYGAKNDHGRPKKLTIRKQRLLLRKTSSDTDECANSSDLCDARSTKCVNSVGSYTCECFPGFKKLNEFECEEHEKGQEKEQEKEQNKEQDKEQEKENEAEQKDPTAEMNLVYTGVGFAAVALLCIAILYIYFKKKNATKA